MIVKPALAEHNARPGIKALYESAFPEDERVPWDELKRLAKSDALRFDAYYEDGAGLCGTTLLYEGKACRWLWYFAVPEHLRGRGFGTEILKNLIRNSPDLPFVLDIESPEAPCANLYERKRRLAFYVKNGFRDSGLRRRWGKTDYALLVHGSARFREEDAAVLEREVARL